MFTLKDSDERLAGKQTIFENHGQVAIKKYKSRASEQKIRIYFFNKQIL